MEIGGLPTHVLLVHGVVVLLPLLALTSIAYIAWRKGRAVLAWPLLVGVFVVGPMTLLTKEMGERFAETRRPTELLGSHMEFGDLAFAACGLLCVAVLLMLASTWQGLARVSWLRWTAKLQNPLFTKVISVITAIAAVAAVVATVLAGHSGATSVWSGWNQ